MLLSNNPNTTLALDILAVVVLLFIGIPLLDPDMASTKPSDKQLIFKVDWFDATADITRKFLLTYHPGDNSIEMYDLKLKRIFLSRIHCDTVTESDFFIGNTIVVLSRRLFITDYGNEETKTNLENKSESTFAMIKPDGLKNLGLILEAIEKQEFKIKRIKMTRLSKEHAKFFYDEHKERSFFSDLVTYVTSGPVVAMELTKTDAIKSWRKLLGPTDCVKAREEAPNSIRAKFGKDKTTNAAHGSDSNEAAKRELNFFFPSNVDNFTPKPDSSLDGSLSSTCCVIKPHIVKSSKVGKIISNIQKLGFDISGLISYHLTHQNAEEFYEIYKGVVQDYAGMVKQLSSGPSFVLQITHSQIKDESIVSKFRELIGPSDPELARKLRPNSLRALFGNNINENAIHCTDLPEDGNLEIDYFFKILQ